MAWIRHTCRVLRRVGHWPRWVQVLCVLTVVLAGAAVWLVVTRPSNPAVEHRSQLRVQGFSSADERADDRVGHTASAVFYGPPVDDMLKLVSAPGLRLMAYEPDESVKRRIAVDGPGRLETVAVGDFTDDCRLTIDRIHDPVGIWINQTSEQARAVRNGDLQAFRFAVVCGPG
ncbi:hypothetical protein DFR70_101172 [Nocardia tenerifensis]|uniref:Uncharacterized protein n=2 Tax=Nocardia tenerifensis TaxID=228006 RepID=A0A318K8A4_9NOCA|nr:hypothetical protein DFR70_101172 [Nocardia tenerifensis]